MLVILILLIIVIILLSYIALDSNARSGLAREGSGEIHDDMHSHARDTATYENILYQGAIVEGGGKRKVKHLFEQPIKTLTLMETKQHGDHHIHVKGESKQPAHKLLGDNWFSEFMVIDQDRDITLSSKKTPSKPSGMHWTKFKSWNELKRDKDATKEYLHDREYVLRNPNLDWSRVQKLMVPKLKDDSEYIGSIDLASDGKSLEVSSIYKSPLINNTIKSETTFGAVPNNLLTKVGEKPSLFMFHTHPDDPRCCPLPSSHDLSTAIYYGATGRFAASVIISAYGIIIYGISNNVINTFNAQTSKHDWELCLLNYSHDVVAAHESMRSWSKYNAQDYINFYKRYRMFFYIYPSSQFVAWHDDIISSLKAPIDHEIIQQHTEDIMIHKYSYNNKKT